jgi:hypothetical protein
MRGDICTLNEVTLSREFYAVLFSTCCCFFFFIFPCLPSLLPSLHVIFRLHNLVEVTKVRLHRLLSVGGVCNGTGFENERMKGEQGT